MPTESQARQVLETLLEDFRKLSPDHRGQMTETSVVR
jgi:hypothetical protein